MGHKRHREFRGGFVNRAPGLTGPGITEPAYPAYMPDVTTGKTVVISLEHPENNPPGVVIEEFTEEVPRDSFGINVGQKMEDLLKEQTKEQPTITILNKQEEPKMEETKITTVNNDTTNNLNKKEETKMNEEVKVNPETKETVNSAPNQEQPKTEQHPKEESKKQDPPKEEPKAETTKEDRPDPNKKYEPEHVHGGLGREAAGAFAVGASYGAGVIVGMAAGALLVYGVKKIFCGGEEVAGEQATEATETLSKFF